MFFSYYFNKKIVFYKKYQFVIKKRLEFRLKNDRIKHVKT